MLDSLELELTMVMRCLTWELDMSEPSLAFILLKGPQKLSSTDKDVSIFFFNFVG